MWLNRNGVDIIDREQYDIRRAQDVSGGAMSEEDRHELLRPLASDEMADPKASAALLS